MNRIPPRKFLALLTGMIVVFSGCSWSEKESENGTAREKRRIPVETVLVEEGAIRRQVEAIGTFKASQEADIKSEMAGMVQEVHFAGGDEVRRGDLLFSLDDEKLKRRLNASRAQLEAARARLRMARLTFERHKKLVKRGSVSLESFDRARTDLLASEAEADRIRAEIALVKERLEDASVRAPFDGEISENRVDPGDYVEEGTLLATLYRNSPMEVRFPLAERYLKDLHTGLSLQVSVPSYKNRTFWGTVSYVSPSVERNTRSLTVKGKIPNRDGLLKSGGFGRVSLVLEKRTRRPLIPEEALVGTDEGYVVFVVQDRTARRRRVKTGLREPGTVEIPEGLDIGEEVVRKGHMRLEGGTPVEIVRKTDSPPSTDNGSSSS